MALGEVRPRHWERVLLIELLSGIDLGTALMLPLILRAFRFDPAGASPPAVATIVDVSGLVIYFSIAKMFLLGAGG